MSTAYAPCAVCGADIDDAAEAAVAAEIAGPDPYNNDGGEVAYRHTRCPAGGY